jgi:hypothetical protein
MVVSAAMLENVAELEDRRAALIGDRYRMLGSTT